MQVKRPLAGSGFKRGRRPVVSTGTTFCLTRRHGHPMGKRPEDEQARHDAVVDASARRWGDLSDRNLVVSTNPGEEENQLAGPAWSPRYPDVVIWQPEEAGGEHGTPIILEEVETASTVTEEEVEQWRDYAELYAYRFNLVVPKGSGPKARDLVDEHGILVTEIITYDHDSGRLRFESFAKIGDEAE